jgi:C1A family cysteine protease
MKKVIFFISLLFVVIKLKAQEPPQRAPINGDFIRSIENNDKTYGIVPPPAQAIFPKSNQKSSNEQNTLPAVYDMRLNGRMTSVKFQTGNGCWDFASMGSLESRWKTMGLGTFDLGEHDLQQCHGFHPSRSTWGNHYMSSAYYLRRSGPISQAADTSLLCPTQAEPVAYVTDVRYYPRNINMVKQALMDYGGMYTMMYWTAASYNPTTYKYFYNGIRRVNHAVIIAGWNDTMSTAGGTGAWIIKNSWGTSWGDNGYFYISYNDSSILDYNAIWPARIDYNKRSHIYTYDSLGWIENYGYNDGNADYGLIRFVAPRNHKITKVGTYTVGANSSLKFQFYKNFSSNSLSNLLSETSVKNCSLPGYYTYDLDSSFNVLKGDTFYVKIMYDVPGYGYPVPIEDTLWYLENNVWKNDYSQPTIETNKCWMSGTGNNGSWFALGKNNPPYYIDLCVKVYGEFEPVRWTGNADNNWNNANNWDSKSVPQADDDVIIPKALTNYPVNNSGSAANIRKLFLEPGARLTVNQSWTLNVSDSLIADANDSITASIVVYGSFNYQQNKTIFKRTVLENKWHLVSQPVSNAKASVFNGSYLRNFENDNQWGSFITDTSTVLFPMQAYAVWAVAKTKINFSGTLNNSNLKKKILSDNTAWNLLGNPYPSYLNADSLYNLNSNFMMPNFYFWNQNYSNNGGYMTYNAFTQVKIPDTNSFGNLISPTQGFFIKAIQSDSITFSNNMRSHSNQNVFKNNTSYSYLKIKALQKSFIDEALIYFHPLAMPFFDKCDANKLISDNDFNIYTLSEDNAKLAINGVPKSEISIPLEVNVNNDNDVQLSFSGFNSLKPDLNIFLEDRAYNYVQDIRKNPQYNFRKNDNLLNNRLFIHFTNSENIQSDVFKIVSLNEYFYINLPLNKVFDVKVYNPLGQLIYSKEKAEGLQVVLSGASKGVFIVKLREINIVKQ